MVLVSGIKKFILLSKKVLKTKKAHGHVVKSGNFNLNYLDSIDTVDILVYFADPIVNLYQLRQWYKPLQNLQDKNKIVFLVRNPETAIKLLAETKFKVLYAPKVTDMESLVAVKKIKLVFYVNQNTKNFQMLRYKNILHVFINHGESDKIYMTTNQFKAYDYALIAGNAAKERLQNSLWNYDVDSRILMIGRPQVDFFNRYPEIVNNNIKTVFYAPTWEGDRGSAKYGSVKSHGLELVKILTQNTGVRIIFRPHPRTGVVDKATKEALALIKDIIISANSAQNRSKDTAHIFDTSPELGWQIVESQIVVTDISAMIYDCLALNKPVIVTKPVDAEAKVDRVGFLSECVWLETSHIHLIYDIFSEVETSKFEDLFGKWAIHYFGDVSLGAQNDRFHKAVVELKNRWNELSDKNYL